MPEKTIRKVPRVRDINRRRAALESTEVQSSNTANDITSSTTKRTFRIVLIDPTQMSRDCLKQVLISDGLGSRVSAVANVSDAPRGNPDVVVLSIKASKITDAEIMSQIAECAHRFIGVPIAVLTDHADIRLAFELETYYNIHGYISTDLTAEILVAAVRLVIAGGTFLSPPQQSGTAPTSLDSSGLTRREVEVLVLLRQGKPNKIIAYDLKISESTVKQHVRHVLQKLHTNNRTEAALHVLRTST